MIEEAEADGTLTPGRTIIEPSSGNTGIAMAMIARIKGYPIKIVLPENVSIERRQLLEVFGAEIILSPGSEGSNGAVRRAQQLADEHPDWAFLYQYANEANPRAHYEGTGPEIWRDCPEITHFVAGLGTSGTLMGVGTLPQGAEPGRARSWPSSPRRGDGRRPAQPRRRLHPAGRSRSGAARSCSTASASCGPASRSSGPALLTEKCGIFAGISVGRGPGRRGARSPPQIESGTIVFVVCDGGWKYLSTGAWTDDLDEVTERAKKIIYF